MKCEIVIFLKQGVEIENGNEGFLCESARVIKVNPQIGGKVATGNYCLTIGHLQGNIMSLLFPKYFFSEASISSVQKSHVDFDLRLLLHFLI